MLQQHNFPIVEHQQGVLDPAGRDILALHHKIVVLASKHNCHIVENRIDTFFFPRQIKCTAGFRVPSVGIGIRMRRDVNLCFVDREPGKNRCFTVCLELPFLGYKKDCKSVFCAFIPDRF